MQDYLDDAEIERLIAVQKPLPENWEARLKTRLRQELSHRRASLLIHTSVGAFTVIVRESTINSRDFSVILAFSRPDGSLFRLRRYNGPHGGHINHIERQAIKGCHVHQATARYQLAGHREDAYAVASKSFTDTASALNLMFSECAFKMPEPNSEGDDNPQLSLLPRIN
jgi:hypothetical protein